MISAITAAYKSAPAPAQAGGETAKDDDGNDVEIKCDPNGPLAAICFKTVADPFVGKMSYFKVVSGKLSSDAPLTNMSTGTQERIGKIGIAVFGQGME